MMRKWTLWLASVTLLIPGSVLALGLGDITVRSALNQPLNAEIELLSVRPGELEDIKASLASTEAFAQAGVERSFILTQLRFQVEKHKDGKPYLKVTTEQPVQEPFLNYLVEVNWASGHVLREYTVLLDPPTFKAGKQGPIQAPKTAATKPASSPFVTPPAEASKSSTDTASTDTASTATANKDTTLHPASSPFVEDIAAAGKSPTATPPQASSPFVSDATPADKPVSQTASSGQASSPFSTVSNPNYGPINKGQGLWSVAKGLLPDNSVSIQQMMLALLKVNPNAFVDDNINTLKANQTLRVPERSEITAISQDEAKRIVKQHDAQWADPAYKQAKLGLPLPVAPTAATPDKSTPAETATPATTTPEQPITPAPESVASPAALPTSAPQVESDGARLKLLAPVDPKKPETVAQVNTAQTPTAPAAATSATASAPGQTAGPTTEELASNLALANEDLEAKKLENEELKSRVGDLEKQAADMQHLATLKDGELATLQSKVDALEKAKQTVPAVVQPTDSSGVLDQLSNNPLVQGLLVLVLLALAAVAWVVIRRRQMSSMVMTPPTTAPVATLQKTRPDNDFSSAGGNTAAKSSETADPDFLAEAEVYLSYKRYTQAEEMLQQALAHAPERHDIQVKLLNLYRLTNNRDAFIAQAQALHDSLGGRPGPVWQDVMIMGKELCPDHPLFGGVAPVSTQVDGAKAASTPASTDVSALSAGDLDWFAHELTQDQPKKQGFGFADSAIDFDLDIPDITVARANTEASNSFSGGSKPNGALNEAAGHHDDVHEFDLSDIKQELKTGLEKNSSDNRLDFDLGKEADDLAQANTSLPKSHAMADSDIDAAPMTHSDEIIIKLDLAKAYIEMGDTEGAHDILDEVMKEGNEGQRQQAKQLLQQVGA